jgi:hypothetical protein
MKFCLLILSLLILFNCSDYHQYSEDDIKKVNEAKLPLKILSHNGDLDEGYKTLAIDAGGQFIIFNSSVFWHLTNGQTISSSIN